MDTDTVVVTHFIYDAYGKRSTLDWNWNPTTDPGFQYGHQGGRIDAVTGRINFRNRDFDTDLMRWVQQDYNAGYADGMNLYQYERSSPGNWLDPSGLRDPDADLPHGINPNVGPHGSGNYWIVSGRPSGRGFTPSFKPIGRAMWLAVINNTLRPKGYDLAADLFQFSLDDNPRPVHFPAGSSASAKIKAAKEYIAVRDRIIADAKCKSLISGTGVPITFEDNKDLMLGLHEVTMDYSAVRNGDGTWAFHATIRDVYDFDLKMRDYYHNYANNIPLTIANNMAWSDQYFGVVQNYPISIDVEDRSR